MLPSLRPAKRLLFAAPALVLIAASLGWCQITNMADTTSTPVPGAGHNYFGVLNETVNPANGSVSVRIALPMPPGRKLTVPFYVAYDSNGTLVLNPSSSGISWTGAQGWAYSGPTLTVATQDVKLPDGLTTCRVSLNYMYSDPSGGRHPLYLSIYGYAPGSGHVSSCTTTVMPDNIPVDNPQDTRSVSEIDFRFRLGGAQDLLRNHLF